MLAGHHGNALLYKLHLIRLVVADCRCKLMKTGPVEVELSEVNNQLNHTTGKPQFPAATDVVWPNRPGNVKSSSRSARSPGGGRVDTGAHVSSRFRFTSFNIKTKSSLK